MTASNPRDETGGRFVRLSRKLRAVDPAAVFFAAAAAIFGVHFLISPDPRDVIEITPAQAAFLVENHAALMGRPLSETETQRVVQRYVDDEVLIREAVLRGLHLSDPKLRARLLAKMDILLVGEAPEPSAEALAELQANRPDRYNLPKTVSFEHRFFGAQEQAAQTALKLLSEGSEIPEGGTQKFWLGDMMEGYSGLQLLSVLGPGAFQSIAKLPLNVWSGPIKTRRGWHVVRLIDVTAPVPLPAEELDRRLRQDFGAKHLAQTRDMRIQHMREVYDIRLPDAASSVPFGAARAAQVR